MRVFVLGGRPYKMQGEHNLIDLFESFSFEMFFPYTLRLAHVWMYGMRRWCSVVRYRHSIIVFVTTCNWYGQNATTKEHISSLVCFVSSVDGLPFNLVIERKRNWLKKVAIMVALHNAISNQSGDSFVSLIRIFDIYVCGASNSHQPKLNWINHKTQTPKCADTSNNNSPSSIHAAQCDWPDPRVWGVRD